MAYIELARYKLLTGVDANALMEVEREIQQEVGPKHEGYAGRELLRTDDGTFVLIMRWENAESAATWNNTLFTSAAGQKLGSLVDRSSMSMEKLTSFQP